MYMVPEIIRILEFDGNLKRFALIRHPYSDKFTLRFIFEDEVKEYTYDQENWTLDVSD